MLWRHRSSFEGHIASWYIFIAIIFIRAMFSYLCYTKSFLTFSKSSTFLPLVLSVVVTHTYHLLVLLNFVCTISRIPPSTFWINATLLKRNIFIPGKSKYGKVKKSSKIGQDWRILISVSALFLTAITEVLSLIGTLGTRLCLHLILKFFFPSFWRTQVFIRSAICGRTCL